MSSEEDDVDSVESVEKLDQVTFWTLSLSFMLKLVSFGIMVFSLPFNEWIVLEGPASVGGFIVIRGILSSDCIFPNREAREKIECVRWGDAQGSRERFWAKWGIQNRHVEQPSTVYSLLHYLIVVQLIALSIDLGTTFVMCCRYKMQKDGHTKEKQTATIILGIIVFLHLFVSFTVFQSKKNFLYESPHFDSSFGTAFTLYTFTILILLASFFFSNCSQIVSMRQRNIDWVPIFRELLWLDSLRLSRRPLPDSVAEPTAPPIEMLQLSKHL